MYNALTFREIVGLQARQITPNLAAHSLNMLLVLLRKLLKATTTGIQLTLVHDLAAPVSESR